MKLTYLSTGIPINSSFLNLFDNAKTIYFFGTNPADHKTDLDIADNMLNEAGSYPFDMNDFFLYSEDIKELGRVIGRNRYNEGMIVNSRSIPDMSFGTTNINLVKASRLPFEGDSELMIIAPHPEEDYAMIAAWAHKQIGDSVYLLVMTDMEGVTRDKAEEVYSRIGLDENSYSFAGIPDTQVSKNMHKASKAIRKNIEHIRPKTLLLPSYGSNFDHIHTRRAAQEVISEIDPANSGIKNILDGKSTQSQDFNPKIWEMYDWDEIDSSVLQFYKDKKFGNSEYYYQVGELLKGLPEVPNRRIGYLRDNVDPAIEVAALGYDPFRVNGYNVAQLSAHFD